MIFRRSVTANSSTCSLMAMVPNSASGRVWREGGGQSVTSSPSFSQLHQHAELRRPLAPGTGTISAGDMHKFIQGVQDLVNANFSRFGTKLRAKESVIFSALDTTTLRVLLLVVHTGLGPLASQVKQVYDNLCGELNDASDVVTLRILTQKEIHDAVSEEALAEAIDLEVMLLEWGTTRSPYPSYYGQVAAGDVAQWANAHRPALFEKNLRKFVGSTEVNEGIINTLVDSPEKFWYFNNGITVL